MNKETTYIDAVTKLKDFINEQDVFIEKVIGTNNELAAALQLAKDMMIIYTFEVIDKALLKVNKMNDLQKELQELKAKVAELESRIVAEPVAKWQPKGGNFFIQSSGKVSEVVGGSDTPHKEFGVERPVRQQAERAAVEMRRFNRLLALRDELCGDEDMDWTDDEGKYRVYFSHERGDWYVTSDIFCESITPYFTTDESAQKACDMLNSGEVEL